MKFKVSEEAFKQLKDRYVNPDRAFRVMINGFGWGGPVFGIVLDEQLEEDYLEENDGIKFVANQEVIDNFGSFLIDYVSNYFKKGLVVTSEYASGSC